MTEDERQSAQALMNAASVLENAAKELGAQLAIIENTLAAMNIPGVRSRLSQVGSTAAAVRSTLSARFDAERFLPGTGSLPSLTWEQQQQQEARALHNSIKHNFTQEE